MHYFSDKELRRQWRKPRPGQEDIWSETIPRRRQTPPRQRRRSWFACICWWRREDAARQDPT